MKTTKTHGKNQKQIQGDGPPKCSKLLNKYSECECVERKGMDDSIDRCLLRDAYVTVERVQALGPGGARRPGIKSQLCQYRAAMT